MKKDGEKHADGREDSCDIAGTLDASGAAVSRRIRQIFDLLRPYAELVQEGDHWVPRLHVCAPEDLALTKLELGTVVKALGRLADGVREGKVRILPGSNTMLVAGEEEALRAYAPWLLGVRSGSKYVVRSGWTWFPPEYEIELSSQGTTAFIDALSTGSGGAWLLAELGVPGGLVAALLATDTGAVALMRDLSSKNAVVLSFVLLGDIPVVVVLPA